MSILKRVTRAGALAGVVSIAAASTGAATSPPAPPTSAAPTSAAGPSTTTTSTATTSTTASATSPSVPPSSSTSPTTTSTTTAAPVDLLAGINWLQATVPSPCGDGTVQVIGGAAIDGSQRVVLHDVRPLDEFEGLALAFLSCEEAGGIGTTSAAVLRVAANGTITTVAEQELPAGRVLAIDGDTFTVESGEGAVPEGGCCAPLVRRRTFRAGADGFDTVDGRQVAAFEQTVTAQPTQPGSAELIRSSVPAAALCYRWGDVSLYPQDPPAEPEPPTEPPAELETIRLALIHVTGQWIAPASEMTVAMGDVVAAYQESRGLVDDGVIGPQTARMLATDLGCPENGSFRQIDPPQLGPRRFAGVAELLDAAERYGATGQSGNPSLDALLGAAAWDGANAMFLGCARRESPTSGVTCSWSGRTPLQLVGLVDDPAVAGVGPFSVLYARSAAPG